MKITMKPLLQHCAGYATQILNSTHGYLPMKKEIRTSQSTVDIMRTVHTSTLHAHIIARRQQLSPYLLSPQTSDNI